jgi:hypothetical protein
MKENGRRRGRRMEEWKNGRMEKEEIKTDQNNGVEGATRGHTVGL